MSPRQRRPPRSKLDPSQGRVNDQNSQKKYRRMAIVLVEGRAYDNGGEALQQEWNASGIDPRPPADGAHWVFGRNYPFWR
jgi:hypothetical protein